MSVRAETWQFEVALQNRCAERIQEFEWGSAVFRLDMPRVHDQNLLRLERGFAEVSAAQLAAEADRIQRPAGLSHRKLMVPDEEAGERLSAGFAELSWRRARHLTMLHGGAAPGEPRHPVREAAVEVLRAARTHEFQLDLGGVAAMQVVASLELVAGVVARARAFLVEADGEPVSWCTLYEEDGIGQVEDVMTAGAHRRRGYGRSVVEAATSASLASGNRITFLVADDEDWPKDMYERVGFEALARRFEFTRTEAGAGAPIRCGTVNPELFYGRDLAYVHDQAFGHLARAGAETLLRLLARQGFDSGLAVELGSGSGITAQLLCEHGYEVLGVEVSPNLVEIARGRALAASFLNASLLDAELPSCVAVAAIGECFNYAFDERAGDEALGVIFARVYEALEPGGLFLFDIAETGRERGGPRRDWSEGPDWLLCLEASEDHVTRSLERRITVFRDVDGGFRRSDELHRLRLYQVQAVLDALQVAGFDARRLGAYGSAVHFGRGHSGFLATKRVVV